MQFHKKNLHRIEWLANCEKQSGSRYLNINTNSAPKVQDGINYCDVVSWSIRSDSYVILIQKHLYYSYSETQNA